MSHESNWRFEPEEDPRRVAGSWIPEVSTFDENLEEGCTPSDLVLFFGNNTGSLALKFFDFLEEFMSDCMSGITKAEFCSRVEGSNVILSVVFKQIGF